MQSPIEILRRDSSLWLDDVTACIAREESDRVPMMQRGVSLAFLRSMVRGNINTGQLLNGSHTTSSETD